ncbi:glycosyltransferase family 2 protein [Marinococcus luteus]|uniref:glycosyltransferase family 2 protein n=1 Tax=Marinococcus luteus TaxID=1122204 RepID=UPI002ACCC9C0|nr:glycosyltransferase family A protein [Marinococcus luteus]MDZ5784207.1 glycosyltransferase family A protein [Marinococcus luteus]
MKVSVVLPTHNRENLISRALESVLCQSYKNLEIIVVSDGSTDQTNSIVNQYKKNDSRIKFISYHPGRGGNYARNIGINAANGKYIAFLDDDDEWFKEKIELQLKEFDKNPNVGLVYTGAQIKYLDSGITYNSFPKKIGDLSNEILIANFIGSTSSVMVQADILNEVGLFDEKLKACQDYDLWIRICNRTEIGAVKLPLIKYYNNNATAQISDDVKKYEEAIIYINEKYKKHYSNLDKKIIKKQQQSNNLLLANKGLRNNNKKLARKYIWRHFKNKPNMTAIVLYILSYVNYKFILKLKAFKSN